MGKGPFSLGGLTPRELAARVWRRMYADAAWDTAAQLGYYFMLALFPLVLFLGNVLAALDALDIVAPLLGTLQRLMPPQAFLLLSGELDTILSGPRGDVLTLGALGTIWAASSGVEALLNALNRAYEVRETRSYLKVRGTSILMTFAIGLMIIAGGALLMYGDRVSARAVEHLGRSWVSTAAVVANYVFGLVLIVLGLEVFYYYGPNVANQRWRWVSPGSLAGVALFVASSSAFSLYVRHSNSYSLLYGSLGAVVILLFWLYILGLALLTGGEINAQIAAAARARGVTEAPMVGLEGEPPRPGAAPAPGAPAPRDDGDPIRALIESVREGSGPERVAPIAALGEAGGAAEAAIPDLTALREDEDPDVRAEATAALAKVTEGAAAREEGAADPGPDAPPDAGADRATR